MKEEIMYVVDSLGVEHMETYDAPSFSIPDYFVMGGLGGMIIITVLLICLLLAAWKAPRWVKEIGRRVSRYPFRRLQGGTDPHHLRPDCLFHLPDPPHHPEAEDLGRFCKTLQLN